MGNAPDCQWADLPLAHGLSAVSRQESMDLISELRFRVTFLDQSISSSGGMSRLEAFMECSPNLKETIAPLKKVIGILESIPGLGDVLRPVVAKINEINTSLDDVLTDTIIFTAVTALKADSLLLEFLAASETLNGGDEIKKAQKYVDDVLGCLMKGTSQTSTWPAEVTVASFRQDQCYHIADLYRDMVNTVTLEAASVPEGSSEEMKRSIAGIREILGIMGKSSISPRNADLLKARPIFAADVLDQFREKYIRAADNDDQKLFGGASLPLVIGVSNALEACLRIAEDPFVATKDLDEELDFDNFLEDRKMQDQIQRESRLGGSTEAGSVVAAPV
ncbi:hypothetical protein BGZ73_004853 [Actinomortierella ambigua]|nr:hypothetical protein BGZ73_004853 [Actinomortierella ambigua]